jgi:hypothetical protein
LVTFNEYAKKDQQEIKGNNYQSFRFSRCEIF